MARSKAMDDAGRSVPRTIASIGGETELPWQLINEGLDYSTLAMVVADQKGVRNAS